MKILGLDTALGACSVALIEDGCVLTQEWREMARGHAEALAPMVDTVMKRAGVGFAALDRVAVTTGPGTFTGQRVGLAFARALGLALKKPVIGITTLDAMAQAALVADEGASFAVAASDAKRGEIYLGARTRDRTIIAPELIALDAAPARIAAAYEIGGDTIIAGTAAEMLIPLLQAAGLRVRDSLVRQPNAIRVAFLAASEPAGPPPKPLYLRAPDAKLPTPP